MSRVRTVTGDVTPAELGVTFCHEHLILDSPVIAARFPHIHLPSVEEAAAEAAECRAAGVGTMVDAMPWWGRDLARLAEVSRRSGVRVVAATGLHTAKYYQGDDWVHSASEEELADRFVVDLTEGADGTRHRCGVIKVAAGGEQLDGWARRSFTAAAAAHHRTGFPILTHCEEGRGGLAQVELLTALGVEPPRVALSHTDKQPDPGYHRELAATGVYLEYDQALRQPPDTPRGTAWLVAELTAAGFGRQLLLGTDGARRSLWRTLGGSPGLAWLYAGFTEVLASHGLDQAALHRLFVENPAAYLANPGL